MKPDLTGLINKRVTVTDPATGSAWTGVLTGLTADPSMLLRLDGGQMAGLPQSHQVVEAPPADPEMAAVRYRADGIGDRRGWRTIYEITDAGKRAAVVVPGDVVIDVVEALNRAAAR
jgi:hypothetical protein